MNDQGRESPEYHFHLPPELIAQEPPRRRGDSRLLLVRPGQGVSGEIPFRQIGECLQGGDLLVLNQSEVLPARLLTRRVDSGGAVEVLLIRPEETGQWLAMARPGRRLRPGIRLEVQPGQHLEICARRDDGMMLVRGDMDPGELARRYGLMPLPPYIAQKHGSEGAVQDARDRERYQTVFARSDPSGAASVAAPTAGLHFSEATLQQLQSRGVQLARVTLHVGPGTFQPPSEDQIQRRRLHREFFHLPAEVSRAVARTRAAGGRVIAVGTTSLRVLETVARLELSALDEDEHEFGYPEDGREPVFLGRVRRSGQDWEVIGSTSLFIAPPDRIGAADGLLTNFHLPGSSLLMLVASLMGQDIWSRVYRHAVDQTMRFYSYGDCMLIMPGVGHAR
jgi:S-adenosylmethionine:tRNA ribosyltransferase-isomerase